MKDKLLKLQTFFLSNKKVFFGIIFLILLFSVVPLHVAHASFWDGLINVVVSAVAKVVEFIAGVMGWIFDWVAGALMAAISYIMSLGVTPGASNTPDFINIAWGVMRNFVNIFFILILVFIGLATILRIQNYQLQKALPLLVVIALLVNFSGVFVGFIVDMSNLTTNVFLDMARDGGGKFEGGSMTPSFGSENISPFTALAVSITQILYYIVAIIIYMLLILVFLIRIMFLWVLTILSPLAFASYILPATRGKIWNEWWKQLIQWSIFVIPVSLFLWLSGAVLAAANGGGLPKGINIEPEGGASFLANFLAPLTALFILYIGITTSQQMAPAAARAVADFGKSIPKRLGQTRLGSKLLSKTATGAQKILSRESGLIQGPRKFLEKRLGKAGKAFTWATRQTAGRALGGANRVYGGNLIEYAAKKGKFQPPPNWDQMSDASKEGWAKANNLGSEDLTQFGAKMGRNLKYTSAGFRKQVANARNKTAKNLNRQEDVAKINDVMPETVTKQVLIDMEIATGKSKADATKKIEGEIKGNIEEIEKDLSTDTALQGEINTALTLRQKSNPSATKENIIEDLAAAEKYSAELNPQDIPNVIDPKTLAFRRAMRKSNPKNLQRLQDNFDHTTLQNMFTGTSGLNSVVQRDSIEESQDALDDFYMNKNQRMARDLFTNTALTNIDWAGRGYMRNKEGKKTTNFQEYEEYIAWKKDGGTFPAGGGSATPPGGAVAPPVAPTTPTGGAATSPDTGTPGDGTPSTGTTSPDPGTTPPDAGGGPVATIGVSTSSPSPKRKLWSTAVKNARKFIKQSGLEKEFRAARVKEPLVQEMVMMPFFSELNEWRDKENKERTAKGEPEVSDEEYQTETRVWLGLERGKRKPQQESSLPKNPPSVVEPAATSSTTTTPPVTPTTPILQRTPLTAEAKETESILTSALEKEKEAKEAMVAYEKTIREQEESLPQAKTPEEVVQIKRNIKEVKGKIKDQKKELKTIHQRIKDAKSNYQRLWEEEGETIKKNVSVTGKEILEGASNMVKELEEIYAEAQEMEYNTRLPLEAIKEELPAATQELTEAKEKGYTAEVIEEIESRVRRLTAQKNDLEPKLKTAQTRKSELETPLRLIQQLLSFENNKLKLLNKAEIKLEAKKSSALLKGNLGEEAKLKDALEKLYTERNEVLSELEKIKSKSTLGALTQEQEQSQSTKETYGKLTTHPIVKGTRDAIKKLEKEIQLPSSNRLTSAREELEEIPPEKRGGKTVAGIAHGQIAKEINRLKERAAFEEVGKTKKEYKEMLTALEKAKKNINSLEIAKIKAFEDNLREGEKGWEEISKRIDKQVEEREDIASKLRSLPNGIMELIERVEKEGL